MARRKMRPRMIHECGYCTANLTDKRKSKIFFDEEGNEFCDLKCYKLKLKWG